MAQLRDARSSQWIASGTPTQLVLLAEKIGLGEVLFDGIGAFDPAATLQTYRDTVTALQAQLAKASAKDKPALTAYIADLVAADAWATSKVAETQIALNAARSNVLIRGS